MDIQKLIQETGPGLVQQLTNKLGIAAPTAQNFLTQVATKTMDLVKSGGIDLKNFGSGANATAWASKLDLGQIARQVGIDETKAAEGAKTVLPGLIDAVRKYSGNVTGAAGDAIKRAGETFGRG